MKKLYEYPVMNIETVDEKDIIVTSIPLESDPDSIVVDRYSFDDFIIQ